jgi:hypothetical protein
MLDISKDMLNPSTEGNNPISYRHATSSIIGLCKFITVKHKINKHTRN